MERKCFVVCPISDPETDIRKRSDQLLNYIIRPVCRDCGIDTIERVDEMANTGSITNQIITCLKEYDLVIVDISGHNPNVFFELGYRTAVGKPVIHLKSTQDTIPFDIANINTFDYNLSDLDEVAKLKDRLKAIIGKIEFDNTAEPEKQTENFNASSILAELFKIQDTLEIIKNQTKDINADTINLLLDKISTQAPTKTNEQVMLETLLPTFASNPENFKKLIEIANSANKKLTK